MVEKNIGALIASRRKKNNMTQSELAARLGISDKAVSKWERGLSKPSTELMPQVVEKAQVFVPSDAWATVTVFVYRVFVWLPESAAVKENVYLVPLMVTLPDFVALELIV